MIGGTNSADMDAVLRAFSKTSELPCDVWKHESNDKLMLASNYPDCILQSPNFAVLSAGFAYHYEKAFGDIMDGVKSFSRTVLDFCQGTKEPDISDAISRRLQKVSGHFSLYVVCKKTNQFWAWNDPFGFMPIYHHSVNDGNNNTTIVSSYWDCLVPSLASLELNWDVVAEYLTLGTTVGDRTLIRGIENLPPGTFLAIADDVSTNSYTKCYGACDHLVPKPSEGEVLFGQKDSPLLEEIYASIYVHVARTQGYIDKAALTGGGDTRLLLNSLFNCQCHQKVSFQTHSKQKTDWEIARKLAQMYGLEHQKISALSNTAFANKEQILSHLHDQTPRRRKQKKRLDKNKENILFYTLHGRFGTEFLGCLCYNKSPLDVRSLQEIEAFRPKATKWFRAIFGLDEKTEENTIRNPVDALEDRFQQLQDDRQRIAIFAKKDDSFVGLDVAYAFQLQLYTRAFLSDIYKGLRGGSWFSMPIAQFSRNNVTPFLNNTLLILMMCYVSDFDKQEPYQFYGKLYMQSMLINGNLRDVPCNNKLLCKHTTIPFAKKKPETATRPFIPKAEYKTNDRRQQAMEKLRKRFSPIYWNGATALFQSSAIKMDPKLVEEDKREEVRAFVKLVGNANDAYLLSGRLQSFLLWHERRFLVHN